jgi:hypothetical protein
MPNLRVLDAIAELSQDYRTLYELRAHAISLESIADDASVLRFFLLMIESNAYFKSTPLLGCFEAVSCARDALCFAPKDNDSIEMFNLVFYQSASANPVSKKLASALCVIYKQIEFYGEQRVHLFEDAICHHHHLLDIPHLLSELSAISEDCSERVNSKILKHELDKLTICNQSNMLGLYSEVDEPPLIFRL